MVIDRSRLDATVDEIEPALVALAERLHQHPELAFEEHRAAGWISELLEAAGVAVERPLGGLETAFRARAGSEGGPRVAILAEYAALPEIRHACGHNLIAAGALGAFLARAHTISYVGGACTGGGVCFRGAPPQCFESLTKATALLEDHLNPSGERGTARAVRSLPSGLTAHAAAR